jgi:hypothetical protein
MNRVYCEKESEILEALRRGEVGPDLATHVATCAICADTLAVSEFFKADRAAALAQQCHSERTGAPGEPGFGSLGWRSAPFAPRMVLRGEEPRLDPNTSAVNENMQFCPGLPDSDFLWWKAQLARKQIAMERATRSIALVKKLSYFGAAVAGLWLVFAPGHLGSILSVLSRHEIWPAGALSQTALLLGVGALVFTLLGSLYLARPEK